MPFFAGRAATSTMCGRWRLLALVARLCCWGSCPSGRRRGWASSRWAVIGSGDGGYYLVTDFDGSGRGGGGGGAAGRVAADCCALDRRSQLRHEIVGPLPDPLSEDRPSNRKLIAMAEAASRHVLTEAIWPAEGHGGMGEAGGVCWWPGLIALAGRGQGQRAGLALAGADHARDLRGARHRRGLRAAARGGDGGWPISWWARWGSMSSPGSSAEKYGLSYMLGRGPAAISSATCWRRWRWASRRGGAGTGASAGWRAAMLVGTGLIYAAGLAWLGVLVAGGLFDPAKYASVWSQTLAWGLTPLSGRRPDQAGAGGADRARALEVGRQRAGLSATKPTHFADLSVDKFVARLPARGQGR